ncbi:DNA translocase FtsK gamma [Syntrophomonas zehnderi OL-4]|uniref:DNA translocase FtsK gamma n=2 Tax=Syntrophomonas TaxID=862 RepID=A0A0E4C8X6_9FIRM|nr:DNA translocase FtsK gamma [Syntrophomonas zehnderi OL-4]
MEGNLHSMTNPKKKISSSQKKKPTAVRNAPPPKEKWALREEVLSVVFFMLAVFLFVSIRNFQGIPEDRQFIGLIGTQLMIALQLVFGRAALLVSIFLLFWSIHLGVLKKIWSIRMWGLSLLMLAIMIGMSLYNIPLGIDSWEAGLKGMGGGVIGGGAAYVLVRLVGQLGTSILLVLFTIISLIMMLNKPIAEISRLVFNLAKRLKKMLNELMFYEEPGITEPPTAATKSEPLIIHPPVNTVAEPEEIPYVAPKPQVVTPLKPKLDEPQEGPKKEGPEIVFLGKEEPFEYRKPTLDMLGDLGSERIIDKKNIKESISILEDTFASFGVSVKVNQVSCGPAVTRYELTPAPGVKISRIISLTDDLQLNLAAPGIRMEAPIPGKSAIGIEVPNAKITSVGLRSLIGSAQFSKLNSPLAVALGEDIAGNAIVARLSDMPHLLIAGSTGSGKSVCLNSIIMSFLYNATPDELKLVFIDPKMVELTVYNGIPHLLTPVVTDPKKASVILRWMTTEMEKRYKTFANKGVRDIYRYNQTVEENMPFIVIIIDELADLMMVSPMEVEDSICRLAQMARAAGIHLIVATQRPSVDVVTGIIKANIPSRIAFAVSSQADSRTILDMGGAEKLLGKGDMLFFPVGAVKPYRVQGAFVSDSDIDKTVGFIKSQLPLNEAERLQELELNLDDMPIDADDEMFWEAVKIFVDSQKASVSLLQRKLRVGYARAARLVDAMEERGLVSEIDSNKKREILIDAEQLEKIYPQSKIF